ncbi:MAG: hypothetical protein GF375_03935 [Candidatus Omnitrophica bacterium]|nr:hypothetical protein [Candidatus Omnitrophota bacterium]MBD3269207.1 hypothetical protein [Candidatus Omnitrophota bacterium]
MIILLFFALAAISISSFLAIKLIKNHKALSKWDYFYPYTGILLWFVLAMLNIGKTITLSNFAIEVSWITIGSVVISWMALSIYKTENKPIASIGYMLTLFPGVLALLLRLLMKSLPE